ncbi:cag pathogenicity island protein [Helicobacter pylori]|nr:cag pathogenicity island protein [Helicobacter pylori]
MTEERMRENFKNLGVVVVYHSLHDSHKRPINSFFRFKNGYLQYESSYELMGLIKSIGKALKMETN